MGAIAFGVSAIRYGADELEPSAFPATGCAEEIRLLIIRELGVRVFGDTREIPQQMAYPDTAAEPLRPAGEIAVHHWPVALNS